MAALSLDLAPATVHAQPSYKVLVFSATAGFRHASIPDGIHAIQNLGANNNFAVDATEDATLFTDSNLAQYKAIIFLCTTGDVLTNAQQQAALQHFIRAGGGWVGIHSASDTHYSWSWYGGLVGAYFSNHPAIQQATVKVADRVDPSTVSLPKRWVRTDEWYSFQTNPRTNVHVLATLDETTYSGGTMGFDHPTAWNQNYDGGRACILAGATLRRAIMNRCSWRICWVEFSSRLESSRPIRIRPSIRTIRRSFWTIPPLIPSNSRLRTMDAFFISSAGAT